MRGLQGDQACTRSPCGWHLLLETALLGARQAVGVARRVFRCSYLPMPAGLVPCGANVVRSMLN